MYENNYAALKARFMGDAARATGLNLDPEKMSLYGNVNGYEISVTSVGLGVYVQASVRKNGELPTQEFIKSAVKSLNNVKSGKPHGKKVIFAMKGDRDSEKQARIYADGIRELVEYFRANGYVNVCEQCGKETPETEVYGVEGDLCHYCAECMENAEEHFTNKLIDDYEAPENVGAGILGAVLGALLGLGVITLIGMAGYVASIGGVALAYATIFGYKLFARKLSLKGVIISVVIMILAVLGIKHFEWALDTYLEYKEVDSSVTFGAVYTSLISMITAAGAWGAFLKELVVLYIFTALGAFPAIKQNFKEKKALSKMAKERKAA